MSNCIEQLQIQRYGCPGYISDRGSKRRQSAPWQKAMLMHNTVNKNTPLKAN